jgi:hypothetical protein
MKILLIECENRCDVCLLHQDPRISNTHIRHQIQTETRWYSCREVLTCLNLYYIIFLYFKFIIIIILGDKFWSFLWKMFWRKEYFCFKIHCFLKKKKSPKFSINWLLHTWKGAWDFFYFHILNIAKIWLNIFFMNDCHLSNITKF